MGKTKNFQVAMSTLAGSSFGNLLKVIKGRNVHAERKFQLIKTMAVSLVAEPFRWWERARHGYKLGEVKLDKDPVFIIGHWRSGTTHLHNLLCKDPQYGYVSTYQGVFPNHTLGGKWLFKTIMRFLTPERRPSDNMKLSTDLPQEEEFALGNINPYSFYNFWYFPDSWMEFYDRFISYEGLKKEERERWIKDYKVLAKKAMINTKGERFISKNPPHTGRVKLLLEAFPNAKFIYIYRNPMMVFPSTIKLINSTIPPLTYQNVTEEEIEKNVLEVYKRIIKRYEEEKALIPEGNLVEVRFEDFEQDNAGGLENIYKELGLSGYKEAYPHFKAYMDSVKRYKKNDYNFDKEMVDKVMEHWGFAMDLYDYEVPNNVELVASE